MAVNPPSPIRQPKARCGLRCLVPLYGISTETLSILKGTYVMYPSRVYMDHKISCMYPRVYMVVVNLAWQVPAIKLWNAKTAKIHTCIMSSLHNVWVNVVIKTSVLWTFPETFQQMESWTFPETFQQTESWTFPETFQQTDSWTFPQTFP